MVNSTHEVILCFLNCLNEIYTILYIANIANTYQLLFPIELKAVNDNTIRNWIIEIKKKFKNYINNFSWFLLHAENP